MDYPILEKGREAFRRWSKSAQETSLYMWSEVIKDKEWLYAKGYKEGYEEAINQSSKESAKNAV